MLNEPRKGGLGVSLVGAVVEPGGHYCRSSDAAVLLCVRIIATAAACVVCCGVATAVNSGNGTEERRERDGGGRKQERTALFSRFHFLHRMSERSPFVAVFPLILWKWTGISGALFAGLQEPGQNHAGVQRIVHTFT